MSKILINKRKVYFINKYFQRRFILAYILIISSGVLVSNMMLFTLVKKALSNSIYSAHLQIKGISDIVATPLLLTALSSIAMAAVSIIFLISLFCRSSEKSLRSISLGLDALKKGDLTARLDYKGKADLRELLYAFNDSTDDFSARVKKMKTLTDKMLETVKEAPAERGLDRNLILAMVNEVEKELSTINLRRV